MNNDLFAFDILLVLLLPNKAIKAYSEIRTKGTKQGYPCV